jgi:hypothetical protein
VSTDQFKCRQAGYSPHPKWPILAAFMVEAMDDLPQYFLALFSGTIFQRQITGHA